MPDGEHGEEDVSRADVEHSRDRAHVVEEVAVGQHHALGLPGGARGVDDCRKVRRSAFFHLGGESARVHGKGFLSAGHDFVERHHPGSARGFWKSLRLEVLIHDDDALKKGEVLLAGEDLLQLLRVLHERHRTVRVLQDVAGFIRHGIRAPGHVRGPDAQNALVGDHPFRAIVRDDADMVPALDPKGGQPRAKTLEPGRELFEAHRDPFTVFCLAHQRG